MALSYKRLQRTVKLLGPLLNRNARRHLVR